MLMMEGKESMQRRTINSCLHKTLGIVVNFLEGRRSFFVLLLTFRVASSRQKQTVSKKVSWLAGSDVPF